MKSDSEAPARWQESFFKPSGQDRTAAEGQMSHGATRRRRRILQAGFFLNFYNDTK